MSELEIEERLNRIEEVLFDIQKKLCSNSEEIERLERERSEQEERDWENRRF